jgi:hypothetical protein
MGGQGAGDTPSESDNFIVPDIRLQPVVQIRRGNSRKRAGVLKRWPCLCCLAAHKFLDDQKARNSLLDTVGSSNHRSIPSHRPTQSTALDHLKASLLPSLDHQRLLPVTPVNQLLPGDLSFVPIMGTGLQGPPPSDTRCMNPNSL